MLLGRQTIRGELIETLLEQSVLLIGARRIGKTELLKDLCKHPDPRVDSVWVDLQGLSDTTSAVQRLLTALEAHNPAIGARARKTLGRVEKVSTGPVSLALRGAETRDPWDAVEERLRAVCGALKPGRLLAVLFDEVPWWLDGIRAQGDAVARQTLGRLRALREATHERLRFVLTGSVGLAGPAKAVGASQTLNDLALIVLDPLDEADGAALFETELRARGANRIAAGLAETANRRAGGSPHWIKLLAAKIVLPKDRPIETAHLDAALRRLLDPRARGLFDDEADAHFYRRHGSERGERLQRLLQAAAIAEEPLSLPLLSTEAMRTMGQPSRAEVAELVHILIEDFYLHEVEGGLRFTNPLLRAWLRRRNGA